MNDGVHQQTLGVDENMTLLAIDFLACIEPVRIDRGPPSHGVFPVKLILCAGRWRVTREAGRSAAEQGAKRP